MFGANLRAARNPGALAAGLLKRQFARAVTKNRETFKGALEKKVKVRSEKDNRLLSEEEREDPNDPDIDDKRLASLNLKTQIVPEVVLKRVAKVFGQYPHAELRNMGLEYLKFYQLLHAVERPVDLTEFEKVTPDERRRPSGTRQTSTGRTRGSSGR